MDLHERIQQFKDALDELEKIASGSDDREEYVNEYLGAMEDEFEDMICEVLRCNEN